MLTDRKFWAESVLAKTGQFQPMLIESECKTKKLLFYITL